VLPETTVVDLPASKIGAVIHNTFAPNSGIEAQVGSKGGNVVLGF
jgi:hypothetical protein